MYDRPLTRGQIATGIAFHVAGVVICVLIVLGVLSPWFLL